MSSTRPAASLLLGVGVLAVICGKLASAMEIIIPLYQYPYVYPAGPGDETEIWKAVKTAADAGHHLTGILNPASGPNVVDTDTTFDLTNYRNILGLFLGKGPDGDGTENLTMICYVSTNYGHRAEQDVKDDIDKYITNFPGVCDGIFLDETMADITFELNTERGEKYVAYNAHAQSNGLTVTFNSGQAIDPEFFNMDRFPGSPTMMSYENFYAVMKHTRVPTPPSYGSPSQHAMLVHSTDLNGVNDAALIRDIVRNAECEGWGKIYLTSDPLFVDGVLDNPWNDLTSFWSTLVDAVYVNSHSPCPNQQTPTLMVPLYQDSNQGVSAVQAVVSKMDYLNEESVWVVVGADGSAAKTLSDAGAKLLCYFDFDNYGTVGPLITELDVNSVAGLDDTVKKVCGGFFVDNFVASTPDYDFFNLYSATQSKINRGPLVVKYKEPNTGLAFNPYEKDFSEVSFMNGPVIVAREVDASSRPFQLPTATGADRTDSALIVTGFTETETETVECLLNEIHEVFDNTYVMGDVPTTAVTAYLADLHAEIEMPTDPTCPLVCEDTEECNTAIGEICCTDKKICEVPPFTDSSSACGDPHMTGFRGQKFDFTGEDGRWYAILSVPSSVHVNMRVTSPVPSVPEITYITGIAVKTTDSAGVDHTIVISVTDPHNLDSACPAGVSPCLAEGSLTVELDGETALLTPGENVLGPDVAISAVNLPGACRSFGFEKYWIYKQEEYARIDRHLTSSTGMQGMGEWILGDPDATNVVECAEYVAAATAKLGDAGVFAHDSEHASFQIMTPLGKIRLSHGRLHQLPTRDPTDRFDLPDHLTWQMNLAIDQHSIDARVSMGILGETLVPTLDYEGMPVMRGMGSIRGLEEDYRVEGPLEVAFAQGNSN